MSPLTEEQILESRDIQAQEQSADAEARDFIRAMRLFKIWWMIQCVVFVAALLFFHLHVAPDERGAESVREGWLLPTVSHSLGFAAWLSHLLYLFIPLPALRMFRRRWKDGAQRRACLWLILCAWSAFWVVHFINNINNFPVEAIPSSGIIRIPL